MNNITNKLITVIIVNYFSSNDLIKTLESLKDNDCYPLVDIQVVDNSCNESEHFVLQQLSQEKDFILHIADENLGFGRACNLVYKSTDTPYVLLINPDAFLLKGALDDLLIPLQENKLIAATGPKIFWTEELDFILPRSISFTPLSFFLNHYPDSLIRRLLWLKSLLFRQGSISHWKTKTPLLQNNLSGGSVLLRRTAVEHAGGLFDPIFYMYFEDSDLFKRLVKHRYQLQYIPSARIVHKFSGCARNEQVIKNEYMDQSSELFYTKYYPDNLLIKLTKKFSRKSASDLWQPELIDLGELSTAGDISISLDKTAEYLVECSPSPYLLPAGGLIFKGDAFHFPHELWDILPTGHIYLRIAPIKNFWITAKVWHWIKN
ncbi:MAG: glycosyltransferase family 2 protein [gamma proteobacterium symbiont of Taylorina sp.]|nr:glycosyltransferase family 2 protein [gamma proteobacterium symbiont of Taylorina sp.]